MAAKFDKELLKKHHFWFLFIPVAIFLIVAWYALAIDVSDAIDAKQKDNNDQKNKNADVKPLPRKTIAEYGKHLGQVDEQRHKMWQDGWAEQKDLYVWPGGYATAGYTKDQLAVFKNLKFGEEIPEDAQQVRDQFRDPKVYPAAYKALVDAVQPMRFRDNWEKVLQYISLWGRIPSSEDMWLAMEDFWVQREMLLAIHEVNAKAAHFTLEKASPDNPMHRRFKSRFWIADLELVDVKGKQILKGKLKNVSGRLLVMGIGNTMRLRVKLGENSFIFEIQGDSVEADAEMIVKSIESKHTVPADWKVQSIDGVEQIFDVRTVPIKRIEHINRGPRALCDRNKDLTIKMAAFSEAVAKKEPPPKETGGTTENEANQKNYSLPPLSQNGLLRYRYINYENEIRRLPVAVVLTTDQSFMKDIVEALMNTKLRFQLTQLDWIRFHDSLNYSTWGNADPMKKNDNLPGGSGPTNSRDDQFSANLMEISIYGIISLYEKYEDKTGKKK